MAENKQPINRSQQAGQIVRRAAGRTLATGEGIARGARLVMGGAPVMALEALQQQPVRVSIRDFFDGLTNNIPAPAAAAVAAPATPKNPVVPKDSAEWGQRYAARQQAATPQTLGPRERQQALMDTVFQQPLTMKEIATFSGLLPAELKPAGPKDIVLGQTAQRLAAQHAAELQMAGSDPELTAKAMERDSQRWLALSGANGLNMAQAVQTMQQFAPED